MSYTSSTPYTLVKLRPSVVLALLVSVDLLALVRSVVCALLASVPWALALGTLKEYHNVQHLSTPLQNFFSAPQHTMRSSHYHCATRSAHIAISIRAAYSRQRQLNRYRRLENDLKKVYGKPSARKHGGRSYNIGANNGSKQATHTGTGAGTQVGVGAGTGVGERSEQAHAHARRRAQRAHTRASKAGRTGTTDKKVHR